MGYEELKQRQSVMWGNRRVDFFETSYRTDDEIAHTREYLLVLGTRR